MIDAVATARVDAHQHFWEIESGAYAWPTAADGPIYRTFRPEHLEPELASARIDATVLVQTVDTIDDTDAMLDAAARHRFIAGVVGWVPLADTHATAAALDARTDGRLRGIRHLIHHEPDPDWLIRPDVGAGLALLEERCLPFDVVAVFPRHLRLVPVVADRHPGLVLVIDHLAKPPFRSDGWDRWLDELRRAAARPNVVAKLSGLDTAWGPGWDATRVRPAVEVALEAFGADRLLFGSDWPVCRSVSTYRTVVDAADALVGSLTPTERAAIMGTTADRIYRLGLPGDS
jgi:L-fuconolactonase